MGKYAASIAVETQWMRLKYRHDDLQVMRDRVRCCYKAAGALEPVERQVEFWWFEFTGWWGFSASAPDGSAIVMPNVCGRGG